MKAILVDDEERALNSLSTLLGISCPEVEVIEKCRNVPEAVLAINKFSPDVVFLDIEMPEFNGFELFGFFKEIDFQIIFVSAYSDYAIRAFEVSAAAYLLKPVDINSLKAACEKVKSQVQNHLNLERFEILQQAIKGDAVSKIALPMAEGLVFIKTDDIVCLEADGAYTTLFKHDQSKIVVSKKLKFFETALQENANFYRPHRSFIINLNHIQKYLKGNNEIIMDNHQVVLLSRDKKNEFDEILKKVHKSL